MTELTHQRLLELLSYDRDTGNFTRNQNSKRCTSLNQGYVRIKVLGSSYKAHRLAWFYTYGSWPESEIDHINGKRSDNRISNLRLATPTQNSRNRKAKPNTKAGLKGASWHAARGKWQARIRVGGKSLFLGNFSTAEDASAAYSSAAKEHYGEFASP